MATYEESNSWCGKFWSVGNRRWEGIIRMDSFPCLPLRIDLSLFEPYRVSRDILHGHAGIPMSQQIAQTSSCIASRLSLSFFLFTAPGFHLLNKILAWILGLSSIFLENIGWDIQAPSLSMDPPLPKFSWVKTKRPRHNNIVSFIGIFGRIHSFLQKGTVYLKENKNNWKDPGW